MTSNKSLIRKDDDESGWAQIFYSSRQRDESKDDEYEDATFEGKVGVGVRFKNLKLKIVLSDVYW